ncbi:MAG: hypothetical protein Ct9H300mP15_15450 [Gemmatimonadota bacterium]|nr:MAG: hypothetical protein Ct9H300mP15_15450 [Gemmatimonadota bacterium]
MQVVDLLDSAGELSGQAGDVMTQIETLLDAETIGAVQGSARELEVLLNEFGDGVREQREALGSLTESLSRSAGKGWRMLQVDLNSLVLLPGQIRQWPCSRILVTN